MTISVCRENVVAPKGVQVFSQGNQERFFQPLVFQRFMDTLQRHLHRLSAYPIVWVNLEWTKWGPVTQTLHFEWGYLASHVSKTQ